MKEFVLPSWKDYYEKYKQCNQKGLPFTPDIYDFFLEDNLMQRFGKRKLVDAVPGVLLSLGIIGTFFGIAVGVSGLNASGNAEAMQSGISTLLGGMKVKFASSIAGISLAVIWQMVDKMKFYPKLTSNFHTLRQKLDLTFPTQEQSTVLSQMLVNQEKQMGDFQSYVSETMIPTMVSGMSEAITQSLTPHLEETQSMMKSMIDQALVNQVEGIHSMVDYFVQSLSDITGDHMKEFGQALQTTVEWQQRVHEEMSELVQSMQDSAKEQLVMVEKTTALTDQMNSYTEKMTDYHSVMENMIDQSNETTEKNGQLQVNISELLEKMTAERQVFHEHFDTHVNYLESRISEFSEQTEQQLDLSNKLAANLERYHSLSQSQQLMVEKTTALTGQINNYTEKIIDYHSVMENMINQSNETTEKNGQLQVNISECQINNYTEKITDYHSVMENMINELNETTEKNGQLQVNISELLEKMTAERQVFHEHFDTHVNHLESRISEFSEQTEQQLDLNNKLAANLEHYHSLSQSQQELSETLANQAALSKESNEETAALIRTMNEVSDKQAAIQQELNAVFEAVVNEKSNVGNMLWDINENLSSQLSDMDKRIEHLRQVWETTSDVFTSVNKQLAVSMNQFTDDMHRGLEHTFGQFDDELAKSVNYLAKAVTAIHDGVADLPDSIESLEKSVTALNKQAKLMTKNV